MNETLSAAISYFFYLTIQLMLLFVLITFIIGLILQYIKPDTVKQLMTRTRPGTGNILGAALGALTPFCSCSTIPILVGLMQGGAPFGASMSFLIASPVLNPIIIGLLLSLFGLQMTLFYAAITFTAAVLAGMLWEKMGLASQVKEVKIIGGRDEDIQSNLQNTPWERLKNNLLLALLEAVKLFKQVLPFILLGAAIGAVIRGYIPEGLIVHAAGPQNPLAIPIAAIVGVPMYIRAATMIPISAVLLEKGMGIGAVTALIIGGAGASLPEVTLLGAIFKRKLLIAFVVTVLSMAALAGFLFTALTTLF